jgi:hypothetical protein
MIPEKKSEGFSFRLTPSMKKSMIERAYSLKIEPAEYLTKLVTADIEKQSLEPTESQKTFIEKVFDKYTHSMLDFITNNVDKKIASIESTLESKLLSKEERVIKMANELEDLVKAECLKVSPDTKQRWISELSQARDLVKKAREIREEVIAMLTTRKGQK